MRHVAAIALVLGLIAVGMASASPQQPENPVIGIITHPASACGGMPPAPPVYTDCIESFYARWLEDAGVRIVGIPHNASAETQKWWLDRVNGVLFQGGGLGGAALQAFFEMTTRVLDYALDRNKQGDRFVVWGTCMGFQVLAAAAAGNLSVIEGAYPGMDPAMLPVNFTLAQPTSRLIGDASCPSAVRETMLTKNSTLNWHVDIVRPQVFAENPTLGETFTPLTTNLVPGETVEFISAYECPFAEVYATQFHPERPPFEFSDDLIGHTAEDIAISQYLANFIASRLKLNNHTFDTPEQWEANRLSHWPLAEVGWGHRNYFIAGGAPVQ